MAENKGFDLAALISDVSKVDTGREQIEYIFYTELSSDKNNFYSLGGVEELASNIATVGLQQPIRVRKDPEGGYIVVSGHRRMAALRLLIEEREDGADRWGMVPCIVEKETGSAALQELRLIFANSDTRKMSSADLSKQAERVELLLYQLKEEGYDFPGRMRDHVAEACKVSAAKLARLKVIREKLAPEFREKFDAGRLTEAAAYAIARAPEKTQQALWRKCVKNKTDISGLTEWQAAAFVTSVEMINGIRCDNGEECIYRFDMVAKLVSEPQYSTSCSRCCKSCSLRMTCRSVCPDALDHVLQERKAQREASRAEKDAAKERTKTRGSQVKAAWQRLSEALDRSGVTVAECRETLGLAADDYWVRDWTERLAETYKPNQYDRGPFTDATPQQVAKLAERLGCSVDYLFLATDEAGRSGEASSTAPRSPFCSAQELYGCKQPRVLLPKGEGFERMADQKALPFGEGAPKGQERCSKGEGFEGQTALATWIPASITPPVNRELVVVFDLGETYGRVKEFCVFDGSSYRFGKNDLTIELAPVKWLALPEDEEPGENEPEDALEDELEDDDAEG